MPISKKDERLVKIAELGGSDKELVILDEIDALETKIEEMQKTHEAEMAKMPEMIKMMMPEMPMPVKIEGVETITLKGDAGNQGEQGIQGEKGLKGDMGERGMDGADGIDGIDGQNGKDGIDGKNGIDGISFQPESLQEEIENLKAELVKLIEEKSASTRPIFGPGKTRIITLDLSSQLNGVLKTFFIGSHFGIVAVDSSSAPFGAWRPTIDFVESGKNIVFDASLDAAQYFATGQSLVIRYLR